MWCANGNGSTLAASEPYESLCKGTTCCVADAGLLIWGMIILGALALIGGALQ